MKARAKWSLITLPVVLLLAGAAPARADTFASGSLIIPMDDCYQYAGAAQPVRQGWNAGQLYGSSYSSGNACIQLSDTSTPSTLGDPYDGACWAGSGYPASSTGLQHAFGVLFLLAKNGVPVNMALRPNKEALGDYDFYVGPSDNSTNAVTYLSWGGTSYATGELGGSSTSIAAANGGASANIYYRGAPFVIDAAYAGRALAVLSCYHRYGVTSYPSTGCPNSGSSSTTLSDTMIHMARSSFQAPVAAVIQTTPKPVGILNYSNSSGFNIALKYLGDAGISAVLGSAAYATMSLRVTGSGSVNSINYSYNGSQTQLTASSNRILDLVWAPDINLGTCQNLLPNPDCFDSQGLCATASAAPASGGTGGCVGPSAWCCTTAPSTITKQFTGPDGSTYYCPCGLAGTSGSSDTCSVDNWQYKPTNVSSTQASQCVTPTTAGSSPATGCSSGTICHATSQHCLPSCNSTSQCATGYTCSTVSDVAGTCQNTNDCPTGYSCTGSLKICQAQLCVLNNTAASCGSACASSEYCDTTTAPTCSGSTATCASGMTAVCDGGSGTPTCSGSTPSCSSGKPACAACRPKWGCELGCSSCPSSQKNTNVWSSLKSGSSLSSAGGLDAFLQAGGRLLGTDSTALTAETSTYHWLTTAGLTGSSGALNGSTSNSFCAAAPQYSTGSAAQPLDGAGAYPASDIQLQIGDFQYKALGGNSPSYSVSGSSSIIPNVHGIGFLNGSQWVYPVLAGQPVAVAGASGTGPCASASGCGIVIYEGANNYGSSTNSAPLVKVAGQRIIFDSLINATSNTPGVGSNATTAVELSRSSPVANPNGQYYIGTFDWSWTQDTSGTGNLQWTPAPGTYPYASGHFREYKNNQDYQAGSDLSFALTTGCGRTDSSKTCNWDAGDWIANAGNTRSIYVPIGSGSSWTMTAFTPTNRTAIAKQMFGLASTATPTATQYAIADGVLAKVTGTRQLGGVDTSTAAVIQAPQGLVSMPVTAASRPTIAYVGALDGMVHAFCAYAKDGTQSSPGQCYGKDPGAELWALIPPGMLSRMATAYQTSDWSGIGVGGVMRVGDVFDALDPAVPGQKSWKTVLVFGTRAGASVDAVDISDPNPADATVFNRAGFRFLWENNAANTSPPLGQTLGANIATPQATGVAVVTSSTAGLPTGVNTYVFRFRDGSLVGSVNQRLYSKPTPLGASLGQTDPIPNDVPALPTVLDADGDHLDDTVFVADYEGVVRAVRLTQQLGLGTETTIFNASSGCSSACQPISTAPAIMRRQASNPTFLAVVGTGGADWASASNQYRIYGLNTAVSGPSSAFFTVSPGSLATPTAGTLPLRIYAQPSILGTDIFVNGTTLAMNSIQQLLLPVVHPGAWGQGFRWAIGGTPAAGLALDATVATWKSSGTYAGGMGSVLYSTAGGTASALMVDAPTAIRHVLGGSNDATSLANAAFAVMQAVARNFQVLVWFGLD